MSSKLNFDSGRLFAGMARWSQDRRVVQFVNVLMVIWLAYLAAVLTWRWLPAPEQSFTSLPIVTQGDNEAARPAARQASNIARWHLFGEKAKLTEAQPKHSETMPETKLNLILRGVIAAENPEESGAIIAMANRQESYFGLGAEIPGGAILKEIYADHIVLLRSNDRYETLRLPKETLGKSQSSLQQSPEASLAPGASLQEYRQTLIENPEKLADLVQMKKVPVANGVGYQLQPGRDREFFNRVGLRPGDIVTAVDGVQLDNTSNLLNVMKSLTEKSELQVDVMRGGVAQSLTVNINQ